MTQRVQYKCGDGIAILGLDEGPGGRSGALDREARTAFVTLLQRAEADHDVQGVVIAGQGRSFPGCVPITEVMAGESHPTLAELCQRVADFSKPVVAAMRGDVIDGGFALALAAHGRVSNAATVLTLGDMRCGLIPGAGMTQRLPRLVGAKTALAMMTGPRLRVGDGRALAPLIDRIVERNVVGEAVQLARALAVQDDRTGFERSATAPGLRNPIEFQQAVAAFARDMNGTPEVDALVKTVEAALLLPLEAGLALEQVLRDDLIRSDRAKGLIRVARIERRARAAGGSGLSGLSTLVGGVSLLGDAPLAHVLARKALSAGYEVQLAEQRDGGGAAMVARLHQHLDHEVVAGRLAQTHRDRMAEGLSGGEARQILHQAECVIEASNAPVAAMPGLAAMIKQVTGGAVPVLWMSNAARAIEDMTAILGPRSFALAIGDELEMAELALPANAEPEARALARAILARMGLPVIECGVANGLVSEALLGQLMALAEWCVAQGASPGDVDQAMRWSTGPFERADREGMAEQVERFQVLRRDAPRGGLFRAMAGAGRTGAASGAGFYDYDPVARRGPSASAAAAQAVVRWRGDAKPARLSADDLRRRIWAGLFSVGLRLLERGVARDAGDIDLAAILVLGLPRASGGPMKAGELRGLIAMRRLLEAWSADDADLWAGSALLDEMIKNGARVGGDGAAEA